MLHTSFHNRMQQCIAKPVSYVASRDAIASKLCPAWWWYCCVAQMLLIAMAAYIYVYIILYAWRWLLQGCLRLAHRCKERPMPLKMILQ